MICNMSIKILNVTPLKITILIADMINNNKKLNSVVTELFIRGRKLNISIVLLHNHILKYQKMSD